MKRSLVGSDMFIRHTPDPESTIVNTEKRKSARMSPPPPVDV
jgi:hypothetical protein